MKASHIIKALRRRRHFRSDHIASALLMLALMTGGCSDKPSLRVELVTSIVSGAQFSAVESDLLEARSDEGADRPLDHFERSAALGEDFTRGTHIAAFENVAPGSYRVRVRLLRADRRVLIERTVALTVGGDFVLRLHITPNCVGVSCPGEGVAGSLTECLDGHCVDPRCTLGTPEYCAGVHFCASATECETGSGCASPICLDGVCASAPMQDACTAPEFCNPTTSMCENLPENIPTMDGGTDASAGDAAVDAQTPLECGTACVDPESACRVGVVDCTGAVPTCVATIVRAGFPCGTNEVCSVSGDCIACEDGMACDTEDCRRGAVQCGSGAPSCVTELFAASSPPGTLCTEGCVGGICASLRVCDATGVCATCDDGALCSIGCDNGHVDCSSGGGCALDGTHRPPLTSCGDAHYCDAFGVCQSCIEGASYDSENGCMHATITGCATFANVTMEEPGSPCIAGLCTGDGRCVDEAGLHATSIAPSAGGFTHACAVVPPLGEVWCWGSNRYGELGWGRSEEPPQNVKVKALGLTDVAQIVVSSATSCARTSSGEVWCWGSNRLGELGDGTFAHANAPVRTLLPAPARDIAINEVSGAAVLSDGRVFEWGRTYTTGFDVTPREPVPFQVVGIDDAVDVASGPGLAACVARESGHVTCWGNGNAFPLGDGVVRPPLHAAVLVDVNSIDDARSIEISIGGTVACVVRESGELWCWGSSLGGIAPGALGVASVVRSLVPIHASELPFSDVIQVAPYSDGACVLRIGGQVWCFGATETYPAFGRGSTPTATPYIPAPVVNLNDAVTVRSGVGTMCAIRESGLAVCWGDAESDALGIGVPALVPAVRPVSVEAPP